MAVSGSIVKYALESLYDELYAAIIYSKLAKLYGKKPISKKFLKISRMEEEHARFWIEFLKRRGIDVKRPKVNRLKVSIFTILFRLLGIGLTLRILEMEERDAIEMYSTILESPEVTEEERDGVRRILEDELIHENEFMEEETKFKDFLDHVRDAILGMSDGLVEVLSVSAGLAGAYGNPFNVAVGGAIVGVAGALSMGIGTFTSVRAQRQVRLGIISRVKLASKYVAHVFISRVAGYMRKKGLSESVANTIAEEASKNKDLLGKVVAEEEYGLKEEALENPVKAGLYTGVFYIIGAIVPLLPYFVMLPIAFSIPLSFILAAITLAIVGFVIAISANLDVKRKMLELMVAGLGSAAITFLIGRGASILLGIEVE